MASPDRIAGPRATRLPKRPKSAGRTLGWIYVEMIAVSYAVVGLGIGLIVLAGSLLASSGW